MEEQLSWVDLLLDQADREALERELESEIEWDLGEEDSERTPQ